jgi:hypothetical protein
MEKKPLVLGTQIEEIQEEDQLDIKGTLPLSGFISGCRLFWLSVFSIKIGQGACRDSTDSFTIKVTNEITVSLTESGKNGLDTGSEVSNTWYYVWAIYNSTTKEVAGLLSTSSTSPLMPSGFTLKRRIGSLYNNAFGNFLKFCQYGIGNCRRYFWLENLEILRVLSNGGATIYTNIFLSSVIPPTAHLAEIIIEANSGPVDIRPDEETMNAWFKVKKDTIGKIEIPVTFTSLIEYKTTSSGSTTIEVLGCQEEI